MVGLMTKQLAQPSVEKHHADFTAQPIERWYESEGGVGCIYVAEPSRFDPAFSIMLASRAQSVTLGC